MTELRQDPITHDWVIVNPERAHRPHDDDAAGAGACPFCAGHEHLTTDEIDRLAGDDGRWAVRVVPNRFPTLDPERRATLRHEQVPEGWRRLAGHGQHEVIVESPDHTATLATMSGAQVRRVLEMYARRFRVLASMTGVVRQVVLFRNQGRRAGTSLAHPHAQIVAVPVVAPETRWRAAEEVNLFDTSGRCAMCHMLERERASGVRLVHRSEHFMSYAPYASRVPCQVQVAPLRHAPSFGEVKAVELDDLAIHLRTVLAALHAVLGEPHYNLMVMTPPLDQMHRHANHWFIDVQPRVSTVAGFELGSRIVVTVQAPEDAARALREAVAAGAGAGAG